MGGIAAPVNPCLRISIALRATCDRRFVPERMRELPARATDPCSSAGRIALTSPTSPALMWREIDLQDRPRQHFGMQPYPVPETDAGWRREIPPCASWPAFLFGDHPS